MTFRDIVLYFGYPGDYSPSWLHKGIAFILMSTILFSCLIIGVNTYKLVQAYMMTPIEMEY